MFRAESSPQYITDRRLLLRTIRKSWKEGEREREDSRKQEHTTG